MWRELAVAHDAALTPGGAKSGGRCCGTTSASRDAPEHQPREMYETKTLRRLSGQPPLVAACKIGAASITRLRRAASVSRWIEHTSQGESRCVLVA